MAFQMDIGRESIVKHRFKVYLSLAYTLVFLLFASTGSLRVHAGELERGSVTQVEIAAPGVITGK